MLARKFQKVYKKKKKKIGPCCCATLYIDRQTPPPRLGVRRVRVAASVGPCGSAAAATMHATVAASRKH